MLNIEVLSEHAQSLFDDYVVSGTDDQLFASGYLRGHVDLVLGQVMLESNDADINDVISLIEKSVNKAISAGELNQSDVVIVNDVLNSLIKLWSSVTN